MSLQVIKCKASGLFFEDMLADGIVINRKESGAMTFDMDMPFDVRGMAIVKDTLRTLYGSFDWQAVPLEG
ncbi:MAG: hypothetical protein V4563_15010 [Pseudomonadota bacterium]